MEHVLSGLMFASHSDVELVLEVGGVAGDVEVVRSLVGERRRHAICGILPPNASI